MHSELRRSSHSRSGYDPDYRPFTYDPEAAKALLAEAGYPDGIEVRFDWPVGGGGASGVREAVEWIQRDFEKVGIKTELLSFDVGTYFDQMLKGMPEEPRSTSWAGVRRRTSGWSSS